MPEGNLRETTNVLPVVGPPADPRVLVVEDEARMRELLQRVLTNWGFEVTVARSAEEAGRV